MSFENFKYWGATLAAGAALVIAGEAAELALVILTELALVILINMATIFVMMWLIPPLNVAIAAYPVVTTFIPLIILLPIQIYGALSPKNSALTAAILIIAPLVINPIIFTASVHFGLPAFIPHWFALSATHITFASITLWGHIEIDTISAQKNPTPSSPFQGKGENRRGHLDHTPPSTFNPSLA